MANAKLYMDARSVKKDGTSPIKILITHNSTSSFISTGISVKQKEWNAVSCKVTGGRQNFLNDFLRNKLRAVENAIHKLSAEQHGSVKDAKTLRSLVLDMIDGKESVQDNRGEFYAAFCSFVERHENPHTRTLYNTTWRRIEAYIGEDAAKRLCFADMTKQWLESFFAWLGHTAPSVNARNIHMRNIRAVFNDAIDNEVTTLYPFRRMPIRPVATRKRNLPVETLRRIMFGTYEPWQQRYIDLFTLSFLLVGINIGDLLDLMPSDYDGERIHYSRKKTHRLYSIKVEPEAQRIIEKYSGGEHLLNVTDGCVTYRNIAKRLNMCLKSIENGVTTYWARHSWATIAASLDIPKDTIAAALGHGGNTVTDIYIEPDQRKVDDANRKVIDYVYDYGKADKDADSEEKETTDRYIVTYLS